VLCCRLLPDSLHITVSGTVLLPVVYMCEIFKIFLLLREEHRLKVLRRVFGLQTGRNKNTEEVA
jgi:hypothetical protein